MKWCGAKSNCRRRFALRAYRHWRKVGYTRQGAFNLTIAKWGDEKMARQIGRIWMTFRTNLRVVDLV